MTRPIGRPKKDLYFNRVGGKSFEQRVYEDIAKGASTAWDITAKYGIRIRNASSAFYRLERKGCIRRVERGVYEVCGGPPDDQRGLSVGSQSSLKRWPRTRRIATTAAVYPSALMQALHG